MTAPSASLDTPVLTVDLDVVDRNIERMQSYCDRNRLAFRAHVKTHKLPQIASAQMAAGAAGIVCQKLGEAEVMAEAGIEDILVAFPLVGDAKMKRLSALCDHARIGVAGDSLECARAISAALAPAGKQVDFLVECDTGFGRTGVQNPEDAADLAAVIDRLPALRFTGLMTHPTLPTSGPWLRHARELIEARGLTVERIGGGGTPTVFASHEVGELTEVRAGTYVFGDRACLLNGTSSIDECALVLRTTVVSRPTRERAILDGGSKALTNDLLDGDPAAGFGQILEYPEARLCKLSEEHGHVDVSECAQPPVVGEIVSIVPNHACGTVNLFDEVTVHRTGAAPSVWAIAARGKSR